MRRTLLFVSSVLSSACLAATREGTTTTIHFSGLAQLACVAVPLLLVTGVLVLARRVRDRGLRILCLAAALGLTALSVAVVPSMLQDGVKVTPTGVWQTTGFWFAPTRKGFDFAEVAEIEIGSRPARDGVALEEIWYVHRRDGRTELLDPGDVWERGARWITPAIRRAAIPLRGSREP